MASEDPNSNRYNNAGEYQHKNLCFIMLICLINKARVRQATLNTTSVPASGLDSAEVPSLTMEKKLDVNWDDVQNRKYLAKGTNNMIHTAVIDGVSIIIKQLKSEKKNDAIAKSEIESEMNIHQFLDHKNIILLLGAGRTTITKSRFIVIQRANGGTLTGKLGLNKGLLKKKVEFTTALEWARQIADGMDYCHRRAIDGYMILHRDLKPDNICFDSDGNVKIIDFGLAKKSARFTDTNKTFKMSGYTGTVPYMAPEVVKGEAYNQKVDVYSFGVMLLEMMTQKKAFDGMNGKQLKEGCHPDIPKEIPQDVDILIKDCCSCDSKKCPNFHDVVVSLEAIIRNEQEGISNARNARFSDCN